MTDKIKVVQGDTVQILEVDTVVKLSDLQRQKANIERELAEAEARSVAEATKKQAELTKVTTDIDSFE